MCWLYAAQHSFLLLRPFLISWIAVLYLAITLPPCLLVSSMFLLNRAREVKPLELLVNLLKQRGTPEALTEVEDIQTKLQEATEEQKKLQEDVYDEVRKGRT